ncbi:helix-turn-helix domain-containing protein [Rufibacter immobilis]|uniref:helix-turn-helix domain-containing protein n=1 Tax=Rufibacter immobilis TaxID=1348778 RepID=UPI0035EB1966
MLNILQKVLDIFFPMDNSAASRFKQIREQLGLTQKEFADELGMKQTYISAIELGNRDISNNVLKKLFELYGVSADWLKYNIGGNSIISTKYSINTNQEIYNTKSGKKPHSNKISHGDDVSSGFITLSPEDKKKLDESMALFERKTELLQQYKEKFKFELENTEPELYRLRQEADNFMYRVTALFEFHKQHLMKFSFLSITYELSVQKLKHGDYSYQDFKKDVFTTLEEIREVEEVLIESNKKLKELLKFLKGFDTHDTIEDYLL